MPVFSLPTGPGIGDLGAGAYRFVDFLADAGQTIWQLLPLGPPALGDSPYSSYSAFAGNPLLLDCSALVQDGLLSEGDPGLHDLGEATNDRVDYAYARAVKQPLLQKAFERMLASAPEMRQACEHFCNTAAFWLDDFARFDALAKDSGNPDWSQWDKGIVQREPSALKEVDDRLSTEIAFAKFQQFLFDRQWKKLKGYANERNVRIYGDMPIFVAYESVDVWTNQDLFALDKDGRPTVVAGVPPDYFSEIGQKWGNPVYRWDRLAETNYQWWTQRFRQALEQFDILRIDHFRGFEASWQIPADAENAIGGEWKPGPHRAPFDAAREALGDLPIVAEDLGHITDAVHALREELGFPGMRVLQFGCDHDHDPYHRPDCYPEHSVAYTGTHDNDTIIGWYQDRQQRGIDNHIANRFLNDDSSNAHLHFVKSVLNSSADTAIIPIQDLLGLGSDARTNLPGEPDGNWSWRCESHEEFEALAQTLKSWTETADRA